jgi:membrane protein implicated in regulation of membrane protease activity
MSGFLNLNTKDFIKGLIVAVLSALIAGVLQLLQAGPFTLDWATFQPIVLAAVSAGLAYLSKNLFTNSGGEIAPEK